MQTYVIRRAFLAPLAVIILLAVLLAGVVILQHQPLAKLIILVVTIVPMVYALFECGIRKIVVDAEGVSSIRLNRCRRILWSEVTALETVRVRQRAFLTVCAGEEFIIISNMYGNFPALVADVLARVPQSAITEETAAMAKAPPVKQSDIVILWGLALMMAYLVYAQFPG